ncbi:DNA replication complex GINS protein PSF2 [Amphibalanus amphitrite]|uniref:DNA replication complex GINS protein PSF2 n=2 Tax=Amphibalanus amphitrite TaxID=1232801 RepID=A0A6A4X5R1_AMPAM|nr:DNA replication complex GINS protein PSF2-like isoform X2 [Amphibalanus amphitrite]XP_043217183.1 DNA replication complex GINS protein PSF2-like isoform X2 [Amphibalanus amphitrite]XP_043217184.1 DNA replication complex GINS protein PSF2-like isoform X2 [Amphibalanus amphitrite]XP_043217185.1 DNA replication complex GINS protein PSF2-like isoform X2 [Amphibalanus amphitrite]XP_043226673.1 DNA replication complex GINS protein PSF2-like [Amphibalanus amphitrite]KAF0313543.1 DNA replication co
MISPEEMEFLAEFGVLTIIPNFQQEQLYLIGGDVGPFRPALPVEVPVWLAVNLRQRSKCRIVPPDWMEVDRLQEKKEEEKNSAHFTPMPCEHYMELTQLIMDVAAGDVPRADQIRTIIKDIWDIRVAKLRSSVDAFLKSNSSYAKLDHLTLLELNTVRPFLNHSLDQLYRLKKDTYRSLTMDASRTS